MVLCRALLKSNQFVVTSVRPSGCGSEANATKDSVDALTCVSYLELRERRSDRVVIASGWPADVFGPAPEVNVSYLWISD